MLFEAEGIVPVATVGGTARRLHIRDLPRLRTENAEKCCRMHRARADFDVEGHFDHAAALRPKVLQAEDELLKTDPRHSRRL